MCGLIFLEISPSNYDIFRMLNIAVHFINYSITIIKSASKLRDVVFYVWKPIFIFKGLFNEFIEISCPIISNRHFSQQSVIFIWFSIPQIQSIEYMLS